MISGSSVHISQNEFDLLSRVSRHLIPIVYREDGKMKLLGSSVFIRKNDKHFLITALHVTKDRKSEDIFVPWQDNVFLAFSSFQELKISIPEFDLCIYALTEAPDTYVPIDYSLIENCAGMGAKILLAGYPASRNKSSFNRRIDFENRFFKTTVIKNEGFFAIFNESANTVCDFKLNKVLNGSGTICRFPDSWGMSGGAMFEIRSVEGQDEIEYRLAGIMTEWNPSVKKYIKSTNISIACCAIDKAFG